jgi:hypothetical protein
MTPRPSSGQSESCQIKRSGQSQAELFDRREALLRGVGTAIGGVLGSILLSGCRAPQVYRDFPQGKPPTGYVIDPRNCTRCGDCLRVCRCLPLRCRRRLHLRRVEQKEEPRADGGRGRPGAVLDLYRPVLRVRALLPGLRRRCDRAHLRRREEALARGARVEEGHAVGLPQIAERRAERSLHDQSASR